VDRWFLENNLTRSERAVLAVVLRGLSNKEVGHALGTSVATVRTQLSSILRKMDVHSRTELAFLAFCAAFDGAESDVSVP
jgi:DNA-binding NarL/FixJ family response regulator